MAVLEIDVGPGLSEAQARQIFAQGEEAVVFALLKLAKLAAQSQPDAATSDPSLSTPSGMKAPYQKPTASRRGKKKPGRKPGHPGARRPTPERVDERQTHRAECCPDCGGPLHRCAESRTRYTEDIPENIQPIVTEHIIHRDWCPQCRKKVEPPVAAALPKATLGNRVLVLTAWLHYALGNTLSQIIEVFNFHLQMKVTHGGLLAMWYRLQEVLYPWYEEIQRQALQSAVLHGDETGWRVDGKTHWLWCFADRSLSFFMIDRSRGSPALERFFLHEFAGTLVSDFWAAYNAVACALRQTCLVHLLRDLEQVDKYKSPGQDWPAFAKKLRRLLGDAIRLWRRRPELPAAVYDRRRQLLHLRLLQLIDEPWQDGQARRLVKRLRRHTDDLLTFLYAVAVPFENNLAERAIRPAVIVRKNSYGNRSERGADAQAVFMSIFQTLKKRGHNPIAVITAALTTYLQTGQLPPLPGIVASDQ